MIEKVTLNEAMNSLQLNTSVDNIIGLSKNEIGKITPSNLLTTLGTEKLIKRVRIPSSNSNKWMRIFDVTNMGTYLFGMELSTYSNVKAMLVVGFISISNEPVVMSLSSIFGDIVEDLYTPSIRYKIDKNKVTIWSRMPFTTNTSYISMFLGSPAFAMIEETPPDDAIKPNFIK